LRGAAVASGLRLAAAEGAAASGVTRAIEAILDGFLASPLPATLARASILAREVPFLHAEGPDRVIRGYCDLVYRDAGGDVVVADYKTDRLDGESDVAAAVERHRPQLDAYRRALATALPEETVRAEILFVRTGRIERL